MEACTAKVEGMAEDMEDTGIRSCRINNPIRTMLLSLIMDEGDTGVIVIIDTATIGITIITTDTAVVIVAVAVAVAAGIRTTGRMS